MEKALHASLIVKAVPSYGGGRGVFAVEDITPGTLLVNEQAIIAMPHDTDGEHLHLALARALVAHPQRAALLAASAPLHPTCLADVPLDVLSQLREQHQHDVEILKQVQDEMTAAGSSQPPLQVDELLRIMLVLRFNAHYSGLYLACEMFNHACNPNCIKLVTRRTRGVAESEIRAVRPIRAGEECCISYLNPPLQSLVRRAVHLEKQHFFSPATPVAAAANPKHQPRQLQQPAPPCPSAPAPPALRGAPPQKVHPPLAHFLPEPSNAFPTEMDAWQGHEGELTQGQVADLEALEQDLDKVEAALVAAQTSLAATSGSGTGAANSGAGGAAAAAEIAQAVSRVERTAQRAAQLLHPRHIVLARAHTLLVDACAALMAAISSPHAPSGMPASSLKAQPQRDCRTEGGLGPGFNEANQSSYATNPVGVALLLLRAGLELKATQELYCGAQHYETARLLFDMQQALEYLISAAPRQLYDAFPVQFGSFAKASRADYQLKRQHLQISALYK